MRSTEELIIGKLTGQLTAVEEKEFERWLASSAYNQLVFKRFQGFWEHPGKREHSAKEAVWQQIAEQADLGEPSFRVAKTTKSPNRWLGNWARYAAVVTVGLLGSYFLRPYLKDAPKPSEKPAVQYVEHIASKGKKLTLTLPDGSVVKLNADSRIRYQSPMPTEGLREFFLEGEAFFEVARDTLRPFVIHAAGARTTVLGTSFNISAYQEAKRVEVAVKTGVVGVVVEGSPADSVTVYPTEKAVYWKKSQRLQEKMQNGNEMAWSAGKIVFEDTPFSEVVAVLERWYGADLAVKNPKLYEKKVTGEFDNESLTNVLDGFGHSIHLKYYRDHNKIILDM